MKTIAKMLAAGACAAALCAGLAACGSDGGSDTSGAVQAGGAAAAEPAANVSPADINPGWLANGDRTSDIWYAGGNTGGEGIFFTNAANDAGLSYEQVDADGREHDGEFHLEVSDEGHLVSSDDASVKLDIVFADDLNCYDYETGLWYSRGDLDQIAAQVAGRTYVLEGHEGEHELTLNPDGTFTELYKGETEDGTWKVAAATVIEITYDSDGYTEEYRFADDATGAQLMDSGWRYYNAK